MVYPVYLCTIMCASCYSHVYVILTHRTLYVNNYPESDRMLLSSINGILSAKTSE